MSATAGRIVVGLAAVVVCCRVSVELVELIVAAVWRSSAVLCVVLSFVVGVGAEWAVRVFGAVMGKRGRVWWVRAAWRSVSRLDGGAVDCGGVGVSVGVMRWWCGWFVSVRGRGQGFEVGLTRGGTRRRIGLSSEWSGTVAVAAGR